MRLWQSKSFLALSLTFLLGFTALLAMRLGIFENLAVSANLPPVPSTVVAQEIERWMGIFKGDQKIGFTHSRLTPDVTGYEYTEKMFVRIKTMGMLQSLQLDTQASLNPDFSIERFDFKIRAARISFELSGVVADGRLRISSRGLPDTAEQEIVLHKPPFLAGAALLTLSAFNRSTDETFSFNIFDPSTLGQQPVIVRFLGRETVTIDGQPMRAMKIELKLKGVSQTAWISENNQVLREEGLMGLRTELTTADLAHQGIAADSLVDLASEVAVVVDRPLTEKELLSELTLNIDGIDLAQLDLGGGRQTLDGKALTVRKESLDRVSQLPSIGKLTMTQAGFLKSSALIQSNHRGIRRKAQQVAPPYKKPIEKARLLTQWVYENIDKKPVISVPNAVTTFKRRVGDCNEHAALLAAMARAVGIPTQIEAGLVYMNGKFYYHAWNAFYVGEWITADAVFNQVPADVSHIRLTGGNMDQQLDLIGVIGRIRLSVDRMK